MALYNNTKSIKRILTQLLCDPLIVLPEPLNTAFPVVALCLIFNNNFEVKLGWCYLVIFSTSTLATCVSSMGNHEGFKNLKQKIKMPLCLLCLIDFLTEIL